MKIIRLPKEAVFTNKHIMLFMMPILFEQLMVAGLVFADTYMVSFVGETAVAGVALVSRIDNFVKQFLVALAQGGSVVLSQYIGASDRENSELSLKTNIRIVFLIGICVMLIMTVFKNSILSFLFGGADANVIEMSIKYFKFTVLSYPLIALYNAGSASFRAMGESKIPFAASVTMMLINILLKYIFIFHLNMGVVGAALSTLIAMGFIGIILILMMRSHQNKVRLKGLFSPELKLNLAKKILGISLPNGIENGMFQLGALAIAGLVSGLGTAAIAADALARSISPIMYCVGTSFNMTIIVFIGRCMGAGKPDDAEFYTKHILKLDYICTFLNGVIFMAILPYLIHKFNVSADAMSEAYKIMVLYTICSVFLYPVSFALPSALRGTGDTKFVMYASVLSMFLFRIGAAYIFVNVFKMGVFGTWVAMVSDWVIRTVIFVIRFKNGKWKENKVV